MRSDAGALLLADAFGAERVGCVKDVDGCSPTPRRPTPDAEHLPHVTVAELADKGIETLPIDRARST